MACIAARRDLVDIIDFDEENPIARETDSTSTRCAIPEFKEIRAAGTVAVTYAVDSSCWRDSGGVGVAACQWTSFAYHRSHKVPCRRTGQSRCACSRRQKSYHSQKCANHNKAAREGKTFLHQKKAFLSKCGMYDSTNVSRFVGHHFQYRVDDVRYGQTF